MKQLSVLVQVLASHASEQDIYATTLAFHAAFHMAQEQPAKFKELYGTVGYDVIMDYMTSE
jgi:hypothetical protein